MQVSEWWLKICFVSPNLLSTIKKVISLTCLSYTYINFPFSITFTNNITNVAFRFVTIHGHVDFVKLHVSCKNIARIFSAKCSSSFNSYKVMYNIFVKDMRLRLAGDGGFIISSSLAQAGSYPGFAIGGAQKLHGRSWVGTYSGPSSAQTGLSIELGRSPRKLRGLNNLETICIINFEIWLIYQMRVARAPPLPTPPSPDHNPVVLIFEMVFTV